jgi:hypothetical protein
MGSWIEWAQEVAERDRIIISRLQAEIDSLRNALTASWQIVDTLRAERDEARADADACAEALRWLFPNHDALAHHDALVANR